MCDIFIGNEIQTKDYQTMQILSCLDWLTECD